MGRKNKKYSGPRYVKLPFALIEHPSYMALSLAARALYVELKHRFNGVNNGQIGLSCRDAGKIIKVSRNTAQRAFLELEYWGFIICRRQGTFGDRKASEYILTCEPYNNRPATMDWKESRPAMPKDWKPKNKLRPNESDSESHKKARTDYMEEQIVSGG